jgi:hypothetical protein
MRSKLQKSINGVSEYINMIKDNQIACLKVTVSEFFSRKYLKPKASVTKHLYLTSSMQPQGI